MRPNELETSGLMEEIDRVFRLEIETLCKVRAAINKQYASAVKLLFHCPGKVVVSGAGKSGLIAQKIAATLVSTGTPAVFLHPSDGMHGDVGIIRPGDALLAISKSGETDELLSILPYVKKAGVPIVSITANRESTLGKSSDLVLFTPVDEEACPLNLAPTSSTTAAMVAGDALAMTLMKLRGFEPENFAAFHPGGQLGKRLLLTVADTMRSGENNPVLSVDDSVKEMLSQITSRRSGAVSVVDREGKLLGLITDYDIRKVLESGVDLFSSTIVDIMNTNVTCIYSDEMAATALDQMESREKPFLLLPVLDRTTEKVVGMVHLHDLVTKGL